MTVKLPSKGNIVAQVTVTYYAGGALSVDGSVGDKPFAIRLLQHGIDAVKAQIRPEDKPLVIPNRDVDLTMGANYPKTPWGDIPERDAPK